MLRGSCCLTGRRLVFFYNFLIFTVYVQLPFDIRLLVVDDLIQRNFAQKHWWIIGRSVERSLSFVLHHFVHSVLFKSEFPSYRIFRIFFLTRQAGAKNAFSEIQTTIFVFVLFTAVSTRAGLEIPMVLLVMVFLTESECDGRQSA